jgi:perosamine synthetase
VRERSEVSRRSFLRTAGAVSASGAAFSRWDQAAPDLPKSAAAKPALLGGAPVRTKAWPSWPQEDHFDEEIILSALKEKRWCYLRKGAHFCQDYEQRLSGDYGAHVFLTNAGTTALHTGLYVLDVGPGDEVLLPGDSFIATLQPILSLFALPVFVDVDIETGLIDPALIERAITPRTKVILPVHLFGASCEMDAIMAIAAKRHLRVLEDACQSPYVDWNGRKLGTIGDCGAVSFNVWKTLGCGEGGLIISTDEDIARACDAFRNNGRDAQPNGPGYMGMNYRPTEFQAALLITQTERFRIQGPVRRKNAAYLDRGFAQIPGLSPLRVYPKTGNHNYYTYMIHYGAKAMGGLPVDTFTKAMRAEGIECGSNSQSRIMAQDSGLDRVLESHHYRGIYSKQQLEYSQASRDCPKALQFARNTVDFGQFVLLGTQADMDDILEAARKVQANASLLVRS